jgi:hypothetical protein
MERIAIDVPLVGGPGHGRTVRADLDQAGRPAPTHPYGQGTAGTATYELVGTEGDWRYIYRPAANDEPDFAGEHESATLSDQMPGGPEGRGEDNSPRGLSGAD